MHYYIYCIQLSLAKFQGRDAENAGHFDIWGWAAIHAHRVESLLESEVVEISGEACGRFGYIDRDRLAIRGGTESDEDQAGIVRILGEKRANLVTLGVTLVWI
jgi:hypothetical protein